MKKNRFLLAAALIFLSGFYGYGQGHLKVMQYNLLYYGNTSSNCDDVNNNVTTKNSHMSTIIGAVLPDILTVNEIAPYTAYADGLKNNALNTNGRAYYARANVSGNYPIANMLYYDSRKLVLFDQTAIATNLRPVDVYKLYYKSPDMTTTGDTIFLYCIVAHLKAGSDPSNETERADMTADVMTYIANNNLTGNIMLMGDFNVYSSNEEAYQNVINPANPTFKFNDPISKPGPWSGNSSYSDYHTQSTHSSSNNCAVGGGMDDRFDFILISDAIKNGTQGITYQSDSYVAFGQDGNHFNGSVNDGSNAVVSGAIADALYNMSDHLPVVLTLEMDQSAPAGIEDINTNELLSINFQNPVIDQIQYSLQGPADRYTIQLLSIIGEIIFENEVSNFGTTAGTIPTTNLSEGLYILKVYNDNHTIVKKLYKQ